MQRDSTYPSHCIYQYGTNDTFLPLVLRPRGPLLKAQHLEDLVGARLRVRLGARFGALAITWLLPQRGLP